MVKSRFMKRFQKRRFRQKHHEIMEDDHDEDASSNNILCHKQQQQEDEFHHDDGIPRVVSTTMTPDDDDEVERIAQAAAALDNEGNVLFEQGQYNNAMVSYSKALLLKKQTLDSLPDGSSHMLASVATSMNNIGYLRQRSGATAEETMAAYTDSLRIKQQILGRDSLSVAKTLNNIGSVHFLTQHYDKAMAAYREAHDIMQQCLGKHHLDVATVCSNIGDVHLALRRVDMAGEKYRQALNIRWAQLGDRDPKVIRLLEKISLIEMGELEEAQQLGLASSLQSGENEEEEAANQAIPKALDTLLGEVKKDMEHVDTVNRQFAIDIVKEKLHMRRKLRAIEQGVEIAGGKDHVMESSPTHSPLTPGDRIHALTSIKERLARIRQARDLERARQEEEERDTAFDSHIDLHNCSSSARDKMQPTVLVTCESSRGRAHERHWQAAENVKERLERLRSTSRMNTGVSTNALRRKDLDDTLDTTQETVESSS